MTGPVVRIRYLSRHQYDPVAEQRIRGRAAFLRAILAARAYVRRLPGRSAVIEDDRGALSAVIPVGAPYVDAWCEAERPVRVRRYQFPGAPAEPTARDAWRALLAEAEN